MASRGIRRRRMKQLDDMGFGLISQIYVEDSGSVRKLCQDIFEPRKPNETVGTSAFYSWLEKRKYKRLWKLTLKLREDLLKEAQVVVPDDFRWDEWEWSCLLNLEQEIPDFSKEEVVRQQFERI